MDGLVEVIGCVLDLRQLPRRVLVDGRTLHLMLVLLALHLERDVSMSDGVPGECDDTLQLVLRHRQHELVHLLARSFVVMLRHREAARALHQDHLQLLQDGVYLLVEHPFELHLLVCRGDKRRLLSRCHFERICTNQIMRFLLLCSYLHGGGGILLEI